MKTKSIIIGAVALSIAFSACIKALDIEIGNDQKYMVINSMLAPDSTVVVNLYKSLHVLDQIGAKQLSDATITLSENGGEKMPFSMISKGVYTINNFTTKEGARYELEASVEGLQTATASTYIPRAVSIQSIDTLFTNCYSDPTDIEIYEYPCMKLDVKLSDPPGESNFYMISIEVGRWELQYTDYNEQTGMYDYDTVYTKSQAWYDAPAIVEDGIWDYDSRWGMFSDELFDGKDYTLQFTLSTYDLISCYGCYENLPEETMLYITLRSISSDWYYFLRTYNLQRSVEEDPFAEPVQAYSNVVNGLGIVGSYVEAPTDSILINIPPPKW